jgi:hypothetical protein
MAKNFDYSLMFDLLHDYGYRCNFGKFEVVIDRSKWDGRDVRTVHQFGENYYSNIRLGDLGMDKGGEWKQLEDDIKEVYFGRYNCYKYKAEN